jgi:hypothetical protein
MQPQGKYPIAIAAIRVLLFFAVVLAFLSVNAPYDLARDQFTGGSPSAYLGGLCFARWRLASFFSGQHVALVLSKYIPAQGIAGYNGNEPARVVC